VEEVEEIGKGWRLAVPLESTDPVPGTLHHLFIVPQWGQAFDIWAIGDIPGPSVLMLCVLYLNHEISFTNKNVLFAVFVFFVALGLELMAYT
jgi:hypothetical protein